VATHPVGEAKESDGAGVGDCGDELGAGDVGAERRLHDAVVEAQDAPPPGRHRHLALQTPEHAGRSAPPSAVHSRQPPIPPRQQVGEGLK